MTTTTTTTTPIRIIETIEAEIESARCVYFAAYADNTTKAAARVAAVVVADKVLAAVWICGKSMTTYAAAKIAVAESLAVYSVACEALEIATDRLQTLRAEQAALQAR